MMELEAPKLDMARYGDGQKQSFLRDPGLFGVPISGSRVVVKSILCDQKGRNWGR